MSKILCIEDSLEFHEYLTSVLSEYDLNFANTLNEAFKLLETKREYFDLVLLDISLPDGNGIKSMSLLKDFFSKKIVPFIVLTSDGDDMSKVAAFGLGADDYILKPPSAAELNARIAARLRHAKISQKQSSGLRLGDIHIDLDAMAVVREDSKSGRHSVDLTPTEFKMLKLLAARPGQVFTRDQLIDAVWGVGKYITERSIDAHISHLRKKLAGSQVSISTVLSMGYKVTTQDKN